MDQIPRVFSTLEAFNEGYAGPDTKLIEKKSRGESQFVDRHAFFRLLTFTRDLAGRQDDFCIICGTHAEELYPQTSSGEIHLCPRQLCKSCWHIEAGWKRDSPTKRRSLKVEDGRSFLVVCCPLCWKRGWDFSSPLLGPDQPEWNAKEDAGAAAKTDVLRLRQKKWEEAARTKVFSWRMPLLSQKDDMTLDSDRDLLRGMLKKFQKNPKRFKLFNEQEVVEAAVVISPREHAESAVFEPKEVFEDHWNHLMKSVSPENSDAEPAPQNVIPPKRGPGRPPKRKNRPSWYMVEEPIKPTNATPNASANVTEMSATPETGRPKRQAARLSFASGVPVQNNTTTIEYDDDEDKETPAPRSLKTRGRKIVVLPVSLPVSPETKKDNAQPDSASNVLDGSVNSAVGSPMDLDAQSGPQEGTKTAAGQGTTVNGQLPNGDVHASDQFLDQSGTCTAMETNVPHIQDPQSQTADNVVPATNPANAPSLDLEAKYTTLQADHDALEAKYRRWRSSVVDNAKLLVDQEADVEAKKIIITANNSIIKQLSSDNARLGAELALARGMVQYNPALLKQSFLRGTLSPDVVERLFQNPDFIQLMQPRPANGEVLLVPPPQASAVDASSTVPRPKKRRRTTAAVLSDPEAEEARQKKLSRVIAPTIKRLEKSRFKLSSAMISSRFDADTAESKRFLDSLIDFAKLPTISFDEAYTLIKEAQQDRRQGRVIVPQLRLSDPAWAPWDVKTAQKRYMTREGMVENERGEIVTAVSKNPKSMEEMVADAKAIRDAAAKRRSTVEVADETMMSTDADDELAAPATDETRKESASRRNGRSETEFRRVWERHEELRREREMREMEEQRAREPPLDMTDPLQALAASMFTSVNGPGRGRGRIRGGDVNGSGSPKGYQRREVNESEGDGDDEPMQLSESP
jgi:hypothetical protein